MSQKRTYKFAIIGNNWKLCSVGVSIRALAIAYLPVFKQDSTRYTLGEILDCSTKYMHLFHSGNSDFGLPLRYWRHRQSKTTMEYFQKVKLLVLALFVLKSSGRNPLDKSNKKQVIMYHPKPHQSGKINWHCVSVTKLTCGGREMVSEFNLSGCLNVAGISVANYYHSDLV